MTDVAAKIVWKLARRHSWGAPIPPRELVRLVAGPEDYDEVAQTLEYRVLELPFVARTPEGIFIPNGRDTHVSAADWLLAHSELEEVSIAATLSRLPETWPDDE